MEALTASLEKVTKLRKAAEDIRTLHFTTQRYGVSQEDFNSFKAIYSEAMDIENKPGVSLEGFQPVYYTPARSKVNLTAANESFLEGFKKVVNRVVDALHLFFANLVAAFKKFFGMFSSVEEKRSKLIRAHEIAMQAHGDIEKILRIDGPVIAEYAKISETLLKSKSLKQCPAQSFALGENCYYEAFAGSYKIIEELSTKALNIIPEFLSEGVSTSRLVNSGGSLFTIAEEFRAPTEKLYDLFTLKSKDDFIANDVNPALIRGPLRPNMLMTFPLPESTAKLIRDTTKNLKSFRGKLDTSGNDAAADAFLATLRELENIGKYLDQYNRHLTEFVVYQAQAINIYYRYQSEALTTLSIHASKVAGKVTVIEVNNIIKAATREIKKLVIV